MAARHNELNVTFEGTYDARKAMRILAELYCKQNGRVLEDIVFQSDLTAKEHIKEMQM